MSTQKAILRANEFVIGQNSVVPQEEARKKPKRLARARIVANTLRTRPEYQAAGLTLAFQAIGVILGAASNLLIAKLFGVNGRGVISFVQVVSVNFGMMPFNLGLGMAGSYCLSGGKDAKSINATVFWSSLAVGCLPSLLLAMPHLVMRHVPSAVTHTAVLAAFAVIPLLIIAWNMGYVVIAAHEKWLYNAIRIATPITTCSALAYIAIRHSATLPEFIVIWFISNSLPAFVAIAGRWHQLRPSFFRFSLFKSMLRFGGVSHVSTLLQMLCDRFDLILVATLLPISALGLYAVATSVSEVLWVVPQSVAPVLLPLVARSENSAAGKRSTTAFLAFVIVTGIVAAAAIACSAAILLPRFLPTFSAAVRLIWILLPGVFLSTIVRVLMVHLIGRGSPRLACWPPLIGVIVYVFIGIPAVLHWGVIGAAVCSDLSYLAACVTALCLFIRHVRPQGRFTALWTSQAIIDTPDLQVQ